MPATRPRLTPSPRDMEALEFVRRYLHAFEVAPTRAETAAKMGISRPTAEGHLQALRQHGLVRLHTRWRGIEVTARGRVA